MAVLSPVRRLFPEPFVVSRNLVVESIDVACLEQTAEALMLRPQDRRIAFVADLVTKDDEDMPAAATPIGRVAPNGRSTPRTCCVTMMLAGSRRRLSRMAEEFGVKYIGHGWNTAIGVAGDLQIAAAMPHADVVEFIGGSAYVDGILTEPFRLDSEGYLEIPMKPGIGVEIDPDKAARYSPKAAALFAS